MRKIITWLNDHRIASVVILALSLVMMIYPRFNRQDISIVKPFVGGEPGVLSPDVSNYVNFTKYFKGDIPLDSVTAPFSYRPAVPFLASLLSTDPLLSIVIIGIFFSIISIFGIYLIVKHQGFGFGIRITGCLLFTVSFPLMYYAPAGYIDVSAIAVIAMITAATVSKKYYLLPFLFIIAALVKEVVIVALPLVIVHSYLVYRAAGDKRSLFAAALSAMLFIITCYIVRITFSTEAQYLWKPGMSVLIENLVRTKTYLSFLFSFGLLGLLAMLQLMTDTLRRGKQTIMEFLLSYRYLPFLAGIVASLGLSIYAVVSAYPDGRFIWTAYPFFVVPAVAFISNKWYKSQ